MPNQPLYQHGPYTVIRRADNRLVILDGPYRLPDAPYTLSEAIAFIADYCRCDVCEGDGTTPCRTCKGEQHIWKVTERIPAARPGRYTIPQFIRRTWVVCPDCQGRGWTKCPRCGGSGEKPC